MDAIAVLTTENKYHQLLNQCEQLEIQYATNKEINVNKVYPIALASCILVNDLQSARHLRQRIISNNNTTTPEIEAIWKVVVDVIQKSYGQVYRDLDGFAWSEWLQPLIAKIRENTRHQTLELISNIYTSIHLSQASHYFGLSEADVLNELVVSRGWAYNETTHVLSPTKPAPMARVTTNSDQVDKLADIVLNLEKC